jgi:AraC-like DNA-binding protein
MEGFDTEARFEYFIGDTRSKTDHFHQHPCCELIYYLSGTGESNIDGVNFTFQKGVFSYVPGNSKHNRNYFEDTEFLAIGFHFNLPVEIKGGVYPDPEGKILFYLQEIKEEFSDKKNLSELRLNTLIVEIVIQLDRLLNPAKRSDDFNALIYIRKYLDLHYNEKINFSALADLSFYSYDHFRHKFKEFTGHSPHHYLMVRRIENAQEKLAFSDHSVIQIALECGFATSAQFCYLFKKYVSQTPQNYRKKHQPVAQMKRVFPESAVNSSPWS